MKLKITKSTKKLKANNKNSPKVKEGLPPVETIFSAYSSENSETGD